MNYGTLLSLLQTFIKKFCFLIYYLLIGIIGSSKTERGVDMIYTYKIITGEFDINKEAFFEKITS